MGGVDTVVWIVLASLAIMFIVIAKMFLSTWDTRPTGTPIDIESYTRQLDVVLVNHLKSFEYFLQLSVEGQVEFIERVKVILKKKKFVGMEGLKVTKDMRIQISASIVQLTYGLDLYHIPKFKKVMIFPTTFYHPVQKLQMKGFTSVGGQIAVSWKDFQKGYDIPDDNYNLGLHELAHALHICTLKTEGNTFFKRHFSYWADKSLPDFYSLKQKDNVFLREYGGTNFHEFFAVVVEHLFESPAQFLAEIPHLYIRTCELLNQNPLNIENDYKFDWADFATFRGKPIHQ